MPCLWMIDKISTPGSFLCPRICTTIPVADFSSLGHSVISTTTLCPSTASSEFPFPIKMSIGSFLSSGMTKPNPRLSWYVPTTFVVFRSAIRMIDPSRRSAVITFRNTYKDDIPVHRTVHFRRRNENIIHPFRFRRDESEPFGMPDEFTSY